ncbi:protein of unknown function [Georgfuchsia toluolica]|uniref:Uncharacterized protein n=1 Tax=Georgfuchsia toluolica TaxID=424218 RepID=A0A916J634_9PROT|nr:protein of unknown function [Georgfuchsia toluolica]
MQGQEGEQRRQAVGQQVAQQDARRRQAEQGRRLDVVLLSLDQRHGAHGAGEIGPLHGGQRDHDLAQPRPAQCKQHQRDEDRGEGELQIGETHQQRVNAFAIPGGTQAKQAADEEGAAAAGNTYTQADAQAVNNCREQVAPLFVAAEQVQHVRCAAAAAGRQPCIEDVELREVIRICRRQPRCAECDDGEQGEQDMKWPWVSRELKETPIKYPTVRVEPFGFAQDRPVETRFWCGLRFDRLSANGLARRFLKHVRCPRSA